MEIPNDQQNEKILLHQMHREESIFISKIFGIDRSKIDLFTLELSGTVKSKGFN